MNKLLIRTAIKKINFHFLITLLFLVSACGGTSVEQPTLTSEQAKLTVEEITSVCLNVEEDVEWYEVGDVTEVLKELFTRLGLVVVPPGQDCDITVALRISGRSSKKREFVTYYKDNVAVGSEIVEPWARATGELTLALEGYEAIAHEIDNRGVTSRDVDFYPQMLENIAFFWGTEVYRQAMYIPELQAIARDALIDLGDEGIRILGELYLEADSASMYEVWMAFQMLGPKAVELVPYVIEALGDGNKRLLDPVSFLRGISGEDFGQDAEAWSDWWRSQ